VALLSLELAVEEILEYVGHFPFYRINRGAPSTVLVPGKNYPETGIKNIYGKTPAIV